MIISLLIALAAAGDTDYTTTGNGLLATCASTATFETALCVGYIMGVVSGASIRQLNSPLFCAPDNITNGQQRDVAIKYITDHPEKRHYPAFVLVAESMMKAFPCAKK